MKAWYIFLGLGVLSLLQRIIAISVAKRHIAEYNKGIMVTLGRKPPLVLTPNKTLSLITLVLWVFWLVLYVADK